VHWQHTHIVTWERKKRKETNKKKLQRAIESPRKAKRKITWRRQASDPLGKGNDSTHPRQNYAEGKSANHQPKAQKLQRAPPAHMQAPPEPMQLPLDECMWTTSRNKAAATALTGQTGQHHWSDRCPTYDRTSTLTGQTGELNRLDRCTTEPRNGSKPPENLLDAFSSPIHAQTSPPCWQCMNQSKNARNAT
jgi:hypothetical protein